MSYDDPNTYRYTKCEQCGNRFKDDCGQDFCSSSCENQYEYDHKECEQCGEEYGGDLLNSDGICENCEDEE